MKRTWAALAATLALLLVVAGATAIAVAGADDDPWWGGHRTDGPAGAAGLMGDGAHAGMSVESEYAYLAEMVSHHREAIAAAEELQRSDDAAMRRFGAGIVASQSAQVDLMTGWLRDWYPGRAAYDPDYRSQMRDLTGLRGDQLDRAFLTDMIGHHMMAVMSSQQLLVRGLADHEEVAGLARTIRDEQRREIHLMHRWLSRYGGSAGMHGSGMHGWSASYEHRGLAGAPR